MIYLCSPFIYVLIWFVQLEFPPTVYVISVYQCSFDLSIFHSLIEISMTSRFSHFIDVPTFHNCFLQCTSNFQHIFWSVHNHLLMFPSSIDASFIYRCSLIFRCSPNFRCFLHLPIFSSFINVFVIYRSSFPLLMLSTSIDIFSIYRCFLHLTMFSPSTDVFSSYRSYLHLSIFSPSIDVIYIYRCYLHLSMFSPFIDVFSIYRCFSTCRWFFHFPSFTKYFLHIHTNVLLSPTLPLSSSIFSSIFLGVYALLDGPLILII